MKLKSLDLFPGHDLTALEEDVEPAMQEMNVPFAYVSTILYDNGRTEWYRLSHSVKMYKFPKNWAYEYICNNGRVEFLVLFIYLRHTFRSCHWEHSDSNWMKGRIF